MKGWLYVISNKAVNGMVRVGATPKDPVAYAESLEKTGLPFPYEVAYEALVPDMDEAGKAVAAALSAKAEGKGWYRCSAAGAVREISAAVGDSILMENRYDGQSRADKMAEEVSSPDPARRAAILSDPSCPLNVLRFAVEREEDESVLLAMLANPACLRLGDALSDLVERFADSVPVLAAIASDQRMPPPVLEAVFDATFDSESGAEEIDLILVRNPKFPPSSLGRVVEAYEDHAEIIHAIAARMDCGSEALAKVVWLNPDNETLKDFAKRHPRWSESDLEAIFEYESRTWPADVARHPDCPPSLLRKLWDGWEFAVREAVLSNRSCPAEILVGASFVREVETPVGQTNAELAKVAMSNESNPLVRASMETLGSDDLRELAGSDVPEIVLRVARNKSCPSDVLELLSKTRHPPVQLEVIANPACPPGVLSALSQSAESEVRKKVAESSACPKHALAELAADRCETVRYAVARRGDCPPELIGQLANDGDPNVRSAALRNPACPPEDLERYANHELYEWKIVVLKNPACPQSIVEALAKDSNHRVRGAAKRKLTMSGPKSERKPEAPPAESAETVRERFRNYVRRTLGAVIEESELLRLSGLPADEKERFAREFPSQAKQLAMFEKYLLPKLREPAA